MTARFSIATLSLRQVAHHAVCLVWSCIGLVWSSITLVTRICDVWWWTLRSVVHCASSCSYVLAKISPLELWAMLVQYMLLSCVHLSVCLSVISWYCVKMTEFGIMHTMLHDSPRCLVFLCQHAEMPLWSTVEVFVRAPNAGGVGEDQWLSTNISLYSSKTEQDRCNM